MSALPTRRMPVLTVFAAFLCAGAGCTQLDVPPDGVGRADYGGPRPRTVEARLALAPVELAYDPSFQEKRPDGTERDESRAPIALTRTALERAFQGALGEKGRRLFSETIALGARAPASEEEARSEALEAAVRAGADVLLRTRVTRAEVVFVGRNAWFIPNLTIVWFFTFFGSWPVADETYAAEVDLSWEAVAVGRDAVLARGKRTARKELDADDFDRGLDVFGLLHLPGAIERKGWENLARRFSPWIEYETACALADDVEAQVAGPLALPGTLDAALATRYAIVVGVPRTREGPVEECESAAGDAAAVRDRLVSRGFEPRNVALALDAGATLERITAALDETARRIRPRDALIVYFAGPGRAIPEPALIPVDGTADVGTLSLPLAELDRRIRSMRPASAVILLDAAFGKGARGAGPKADEASSEATRRALQALGASEPRAPRRAVLAAAAPGLGARELGSSGRGIFTFHLLRALDGAADADRSGWTTIEEAERFLDAEVSATAGLLGGEQTPLRTGSADLRLPLEPSTAAAAASPTPRAGG